MLRQYRIINFQNKLSENELGKVAFMAGFYIRMIF